MDQIRICNLRCLADTEVIELKPITILVGANSSGKSSFLRVFPLIRQSIETRTVSGLLLNEGDVNFGFFHEALHRDASPAEMKLEFGFTLQPGFYQGSGVNRFLLDEGKISKFTVNEYQAESDIPPLRLRVERGLVPTLVRVLDEKKGATSLLSDEFGEVGMLDHKIIADTDGLFHGRTSDETRLATILAVKIGSAEQMLAATKQLGGVSSWNQRVQGWTTETPIFRRIRNYLLAKSANSLLSAANLAVSQLARSVHYFQPVRASVQRDYVSRDVQVESVDATGLNVALVLASLGSSAQHKFRDWLKMHFGFEVFPQSVSDGARVSLRMKEEGSDVEFNLADMGFGFSQMLPFLVEMWNLTENQTPRRVQRYANFSPRDSSSQRGFIIAVEQPELHLHPALQARVADLFVSIARLSRERNLPVRFILETHSPTIIERIGQLVEANHLKTDDVQVLLFERGRRGTPANTATVRRTEFDTAGVLKDWPFGFLSPPVTPVPILPTPSEIAPASSEAAPAS
ncbi:MAG: AAA family ATPase [Verrucomicrobia bacterium]|nr:AAA family ATPase [Verrucomicrobiota bacterium]